MPDHVNGSQRGSAPHLARVGVLLGMALVLSLLEHVLPPLPSPVPLRYGLANVAVMAALLFAGGRDALVIAFLKSLFVLMTRGLMAGLISLSGSLVSAGLMIALEKLSHSKISIFLLSTLGAIAHNLGQFLFLVFYQRYRISFAYIAPCLIVFGLLTGLLSALLLRVVRRPLEVFFQKRSGQKTGQAPEQ